MNPPNLASEHAPCYARRGRIERPAQHPLVRPGPNEGTGTYPSNELRRVVTSASQLSFCSGDIIERCKKSRLEEREADSLEAA